MMDEYDLQVPEFLPVDIFGVRRPICCSGTGVILEMKAHAAEGHYSHCD